MYLRETNKHRLYFWPNDVNFLCMLETNFTLVVGSHFCAQEVLDTQLSWIRFEKHTLRQPILKLYGERIRVLAWVCKSVSEIMHVVLQINNLKCGCMNLLILFDSHFFLTVELK